QNLNDLQKQIALLSQVLGDEKGAEVNREDKADVFRRMEKVKEEIRQLETLSDPSERSPVTALLTDYTQLSESWRKVYENLGINQTQAVLELVTKADPLTQRVMQQSMPRLQEEERRLVEQASSNFYAVARFTNRTTVLIFILSTVFATAVAYVVSRHLTV